MRISTECHDCLMRLADQASDFATDDAGLRETSKRAAEKLIRDKLKPGIISIEVAAPLHHLIKQVTGNQDPYRKFKDIEIGEARKLFALVQGGYKEDFVDCLRLAAQGNAMDFFRPIEELEKEFLENRLQFAIDDSALLEGRVQSSSLVLYLADNSGEVFFDMPLLNLMRRYARTIYVVKELPVQNDVTIADIRKAGLEKQAGEVMTTGTATPGVLFELASEEFKQAFAAADFVFAKGMGYYESLDELAPQGKIFFCLKAKCGPVARSLGVPLNSYVAKLH
ncbi:MAG: ARMT1-like domain-containing protein [Dehalococcoidia bacterium]